MEEDSNYYEVDLGRVVGWSEGDGTGGGGMTQEQYDALLSRIDGVSAMETGHYNELVSRFDALDGKLNQVLEKVNSLDSGGSGNGVVTSDWEEVVGGWEKLDGGVWRIALTSAFVKNGMWVVNALQPQTTNVSVSTNISASSGSSANVIFNDSTLGSDLGLSSLKKNYTLDLVEGVNILKVEAMGAASNTNWTLYFYVTLSPIIVEG